MADVSNRSDRIVKKSTFRNERCAIKDSIIGVRAR